MSTTKADQIFDDYPPLPPGMKPADSGIHVGPDGEPEVDVEDPEG